MAKNVKKQIMALVLAFTIVFAGVASVHIEADAATTYMKKIGVKWGLKAGKTYTFTTQYAGVGTKNVTWTLSDMKKKSAKKKNFKQISFVLTYQDGFHPTAAEVDQVMKNDYGMTYSNTGASFWYAIVDASTGLDLEHTNNVKVKIKTKDLPSEKNTYNGTDGAWMEVPNVWKKQVTVVYPSDFKNLSIGFGGGNVLSGNQTQEDTDFWDGSVPFGKTTYYKKGKTNGKWMIVH